MEPKPKKRTVSATVEILGTEASAEPEDEEDGPRPGLKSLFVASVQT